MKTTLYKFILAILFLVLWNTSSYATAYFAKAGATVNGNGTSWNTAFTVQGMETALANNTFISGDSIYLSGGIYLPGSAGFKVQSGLTLVGGYDPALTGTLRTIPTYPTLTPTIFSGDVNGNYMADAGDIQNIVTIENIPSSTPATLQGIQFSYAYYDGILSDNAGAVMAKNSTIKLKDCIFDGNRAPNSDGGGGLTALSCYTHALDCIFQNNSAKQRGGAIRLSVIDSNINPDNPAWTVIERCLITNNQLNLVDKISPSGKFGAGIQLTSGVLWVVNSTIAANQARMNGTGISASEGASVKIISSTFADNKSSNYENQMGTSSNRSIGTSLRLETTATLDIVNSISVEMTDAGDTYNPTFFTGDLNKTPLGLASAYIKSYGNNVTGTFWFNPSPSPNDDQWNTDGSSNIWQTTDNPSRAGYNINTYGSVFGDNALIDNGGFSFTLPTYSPIAGATVSDLQSMVNSTWACPVALDLTVDQRGYKRQAITNVGAYDAGAIASIRHTTVTQATIAMVGEHSYKLITEKNSDVVVYNSTGQLMRKTTSDHTIDLSSCSPGIYLIISNGNSFKVIR